MCVFVCLFVCRSRKAITLVLSRERHWVMWKYNPVKSCPEIELKPLGSVAEPMPVKKSGGGGGYARRACRLPR